MTHLFSRWGHGRWRNAVDAYVDGELPGPQRKRLEEHAAFCTRCSALLRERRTMKLLLSQMPEVPAPRSFQLTPAMAEQARGRPAARADTPRAAAWPLRTAQFTAGLAIVALVAVFAFDITNGDGTGERPATASSSGVAALAAPESAQTPAASAPDPESTAGVIGSKAAATPGALDSGRSVQDEATRTANGVAPPQSSDVGAQAVPQPSPTAEPGEHTFAAAANGESEQPATKSEPQGGELSRELAQPAAAPKNEANDSNAGAFRSAELGLAAVAVIAAATAVFFKRRRS